MQYSRIFGILYDVCSPWCTMIVILEDTLITVNCKMEEQYKDKYVRPEFYHGKTC